MLDQPQRAGLRPLLGFRFEGEMTFLRAEAKHLDPWAEASFQLGFQAAEVVSPGRLPETGTSASAGARHRPRPMLSSRGS